VPDAAALFLQSLRLDPECARPQQPRADLPGRVSRRRKPTPSSLCGHNLKAYKLLGSLNAARNLARNYFLLKRYADALPLYEELDKAPPGRYDVRYELGICCYMTGRTERAAKLLTAADFNRRGVSLWEEGAYAEAEKFIRHALELADPRAAGDRILYYCNLATVLGTGKTSRGASPVTARPSRSPRAAAPSTSGCRATSTCAGGPPGHPVLRAVPGLDPDNLRAHKNLGLIYLGDADERLANYRLALRHNEKAFALQKSTETTWNLARNYYALERDYEALVLFEELVDQSPEDADAHYYLAWSATTWATSTAPSSTSPGPSPWIPPSRTTRWRRSSARPSATPNRKKPRPVVPPPHLV